MPVTVADSVGPRHRRLSRLESGAGEPRVGCERDPLASKARVRVDSGRRPPAETRRCQTQARADPSTVFGGSPVSSKRVTVAAES